MTRDNRRPTAEELALWQQIVEDVIPLDSTGLTSAGAPSFALSETAIKKIISTAPGLPPEQKSQRPSPRQKSNEEPGRSPRGHLPGLDRKTSQRLKRGTIAIDARLDLHGMTQTLAHGRLVIFVRQAQKTGSRCVLVITGKGDRKSAQSWYDQPGILREMVPRWLAAPDMKPVILAVTGATRHHGGDGAYYVYLRRERIR